MIKAKLKLARGHAHRLLTHKCIDYSQWFPGDDNDIADSLSQDNHLSDDKLTSLFFSSVPEQTPQDFKISPIPQEIESFILSLLEKLPGESQTREKHKHSSVSRGLVGCNSSNQSRSTTIPSSQQP